MLLLGGMLVIGEVERRHRGIVRRNRSEGESAPMTLGQALAAQVRLIVWCKSCWHRAEPDVAESGRALWRRNHRHRLGLPVDVFGLRWATRWISLSLGRRGSLGAGALSRPLVVAEGLHRLFNSRPEWSHLINGAESRRSARRNSIDASVR